MTRHMRTTVLGAAMLGSALLSAGANAQPPQLGPPHDRRAEISPRGIEVSFPLPYRELEAPNPPVLGFYAWRMTIESEPKLSVVLYTPEPVRTNNVEEIMRKAVLRLCPSTTSTIDECTTPVKGRGRVNPASIKMDITDPAVVSRVRRARPGAYWRSVIEPGGMYSVKQMPFRYVR